jgi:alkylation response protein AidB-like acyl-CoA dehydrogenase
VNDRTITDPRTAPRGPGTGPDGTADPAFRARLDGFLTEHRALLDDPRWEDGTPPVPALLAAAGAAGLVRDAWAAGPADRPRALWRAVDLHAALARVGGGAPGAAVLTHLDVATRLLGALPGADRALVDGALAGRTTSALAATEPEHGSDLARLTTRVHRDGDRLAVTGGKWFISNAPFADHLLVLADDPDAATGRPGPALLLVAAGAPGVATTPLDALGHRGLTGRVRLDAAPVSAVLVPGGHGLLVLMRHWLHERVMLAVRMGELADAVLRHAVAAARQRHTFGVPLLGNQHVRFTLARLTAETEEVRAAARQGVRLLAEGSCPAAYAAACKHRAAAVLREVADEALQLAGGDGYRTGHPANRALRDALGLALAGGTDELMLQQIDRG